MGSCRSLTFKPDFKVSTSGKTSRKDGASLDAKILYPTGALGANQASSQSNVKMVKVDLPKQLPSRLTTLQKACPSATFEANPASCPEDSRVGSATAITPVLPVQLTGPAYFVSYGGAKFPELVVVLQGYGVTVYLHGETFISKAGITSSTFRKVPDVPITSFELKLPEGPYLGACGEREPVHDEADDAHSVHRPERRGDQAVHADQRDRLRQAQGEEDQEESQSQVQARQEEMRREGTWPRSGVVWR